MLGNQIYQNSMDNGEAWLVNDAFGKPIYSWDTVGKETQIYYDVLHRPETIVVMIGGSGDCFIHRFIILTNETNRKTALKNK